MMDGVSASRSGVFFLYIFDMNGKNCYFFFSAECCFRVSALIFMLSSRFLHHEIAGLVLMRY